MSEKESEPISILDQIKALERFRNMSWMHGERGDNVGNTTEWYRAADVLAILEAASLAPQPQPESARYPGDLGVHDDRDGSSFHHERLRDSAPRPASGPSAWQPIETAPKDTEILVYDDGVILISLFIDDVNGQTGWWDNGIMAPPPTHWMPLPDPPSALPVVRRDAETEEKAEDLARVVSVPQSADGDLPQPASGLKTPENVLVIPPGGSPQLEPSDVVRVALEGRIEHGDYVLHLRDSPVVLTILVEREDDGQYFASWETKKEGGSGDYSATPIGALAELLCTLLLVEEDRINEGEGREFSKPSAPVVSPPSVLEDYEDAKRYLGALFLRCAPQCEPLSTLTGIATQIDNYIAGLHQRLADNSEGVSPPSAEGRWQPIETAPRDGTVVMVTDGTDVWAAITKAWCGAAKHWMPLPAPPSPPVPLAPDGPASLPARARLNLPRTGGKA